MRVRDETASDRAAIRAVHDRAFGGAAEGRLVDALRDGGHARASLVAVEDERVVGHVLFGALEILAPDGIVASIALAPLAVDPERQRRGIGSALVRAGLERCRELGAGSVVVLGDPAFYGRFGFDAALARTLASPYAGPHLQALELRPGALRGITGTLRYPPPFDAL